MSVLTKHAVLGAEAKGDLVLNLETSTALTKWPSELVHIHHLSLPLTRVQAREPTEFKSSKRALVTLSIITAAF